MFESFDSKDCVKGFLIFPKFKNGNISFVIDNDGKKIELFVFTKLAYCYMRKYDFFIAEKRDWNLYYNGEHKG